MLMTVHTALAHARLGGLDAAGYEALDDQVHLRGIALVAATCVALISAPCLWRLARISADEVPADVWWRRPAAIMAAALPLMLTLLRCSVLMWPRSLPVTMIVAACVECFAIWCFYQLVLSFLGATEADVVGALASCLPCRMWVAPPFGPCVPLVGSEPRTPGPDDFFIVQCCVWQFVCLFPFIAIVEEITHEPAYMIALTLARFATFFTLLYGIMALVFAAHDLLRDRWCHTKFWALKSIMVVSMVSFRLCLRYAMTHSAGLGTTFDEQLLLAAQQSAVVTALCAVPTAAVALMVFTPDDLEHPLKKKRAS